MFVKYDIAFGSIINVLIAAALFCVPGKAFLIAAIVLVALSLIQFALWVFKVNFNTFFAVVFILLNLPAAFLCLIFTLDIVQQKDAQNEIKDLKNEIKKLNETLEDKNKK